MLAFAENSASPPGLPEGQTGDHEVLKRCRLIPSFPILNSSVCLGIPSFAAAPVGPKITPSLQLFRSQSRLPQVIGQMIGTTQQDGKTVTQRFFQKVFLRHGTVLL